MKLHLPKRNPKDGFKPKAKAMGKIRNENDTAKELHKKFRAERGAITAFCDQKGITPEWLRLVFIGEYQDIDLMLDAAEFLAKFKAEKEALHLQKANLLHERVQALA